MSKSHDHRASKPTPHAAAGPSTYWRSLEELADSEAFQEMVRQKFPQQAADWPDPLSRRQFLTLMGASLALAGLSGCSVKPAPSVDIVPYVHPAEEAVPGKPLFFATTMTMAGSPLGYWSKATMAGRPKSKAIPIIRPALGQRTSSIRRRC